jgi:hypothetical protein
MKFFLVLQSLFAVGCLVLKFKYWLKIPASNPSLLFSSFFKHYSTYLVYNSRNNESKIFKQKSNRINLFFWINIILGIIIFYLYKLETANMGSDII